MDFEETSNFAKTLPLAIYPKRSPSEGMQRHNKLFVEQRKLGHDTWLKGKGKGILFNVGGQTGKDCLFTWADGVKVADRRDLACWTNARCRGRSMQWLYSNSKKCPGVNIFASRRAFMETLYSLEFFCSKNKTACSRVGLIGAVVVSNFATCKQTHWEYPRLRSVLGGRC